MTRSSPDVLDQWTSRLPSALSDHQHGKLELIRAVTLGSEAAFVRCHLMLKPILCSIVILMAAAAHAQPVSPRYDFRGIIPPDWKVVPSPRGSNERKFISPQGEASIAFRAEHAREPAAVRLAHLRTVRDGEITYEREGRTWIVISGFKGTRIFYTKAMLACGGRAWHYVQFHYPAAEKRAFDEFVTRSSRALAAYAQSGCDG